MSISTSAGRPARKFKTQQPIQTNLDTDEVPAIDIDTQNANEPQGTHGRPNGNRRPIINFPDDTEKSKKFPMSQEKWEQLMSGENPLSEKTNEKLQVINEAKQETIKDLEKEALEDSYGWIPIKSLPSNNKIYKSDNTVFFKKYTFEDFESTSVADMIPQQRFKIMLQGLKCSELKSILLLPFYDFTAASFIRKIEAQGQDRKYAIPYRCNKCKQVGTFEFSLKDVQFDSLDIEIPIKVRLHSFPDVIFEFSPHTVGDAIYLMDEDKYYAKNEEGEYLLDITGSPYVDRKSMLAVCCNNFDFNTAYKYFQKISYKEDYDILMQVADKLRFGIKNIEFDCKLPKPKESEDEKEQESIDAEIEKQNDEKLNMIRDWKGELPPILKALQARENICGQHISIDILGGDVIFLPFREHEDATEYGILSS